MFTYHAAEQAEHITLRECLPEPMTITDDVPYSPPAPQAIQYAPADDFDIAPADAIIELQRRAMPVLRHLRNKVESAESTLTGINNHKPVRTLELARRNVDQGVFHTDSDGLLLTYKIRCNGTEHMKHLLANGDLYPEGYRAVEQSSTLGGNAVQYTMLHNSVKQLSDLFSHPANLVLVEPVVEHEINVAQRQLSDARQELHEYKVVTKKRLTTLDKQFKSMLD